MATLNGNGAPTRKTTGAIGDIYTDTNTGDQYKCIFSYRSNTDEDYDCQWKKISTGKKPNAKPEVKEVKETKEVKQEEKEVKTVEKTVPANEPPKRTDYTAYGKKNNG